LIAADQVCGLIEALVGKLDMEGLEFLRAEPAETERPGYDPRDLLKLYLYGYLQPVRWWRARLGGVGANGAAGRAGEGREGGDGGLEVPCRE